MSDTYLTHISKWLLHFSIADLYDMILCIGSLTPTHITDEAFEELIRITKPGKNPIKLANNPNIKETQEYKRKYKRNSKLSSPQFGANDPKGGQKKLYY